LTRGFDCRRVAEGSVKTTLAAIIAVGVLAVGAADAGAKTFSAQSGNVQATLTYSGSAGFYTATNLRIVRNGATLLDAAPRATECGPGPCGPSGYQGDPPLRVVDLDGNGEPEVIYSAYTGGAHCCSIALVYRLSGTGTGYALTEHGFGDPGFTLKDLNGDGRPEWVTADDRFAYLYTAYAFSGLPLQILSFANGRFTDVTASYPALVRRDARRWWSRYHRARNRTDGTQLGVLAAWAADRYKLGRRKAALRVLRAEARAGRLKGPGLHGATFVTRLDRFLRRHGY
jgi:hypothetical protein